jgi:hypothetical protein
MINQGNAFSAGSLGNVLLAVDRPSNLTIEMAVRDRDGKELCRLSTVIDLKAPEIRT